MGNPSLAGVAMVHGQFGRAPRPQGARSLTRALFRFTIINSCLRKHEADPRQILMRMRQGLPDDLAAPFDEQIRAISRKKGFYNEP